MNIELVILSLAVGIGTYLFRFLPTRFRAASGRQRTGALSRFFAAIGPAAIATLFVASILPLTSTLDGGTLCTLIGSVAVVALFWWRRDVVIATLGGATAYGLAYQALAIGV